jgi:hypothetical protein
MSTDKKSPPLNLPELRQLQWVLGGLLILIASGTVLFLEVESWTAVLLTAGATLACLVRPDLPGRVPRWLHRLAFPFILCAFLADLWWTAEVLPSFIRLDLLLLLYRGISYRGRREDMQVVLLGLFLLIVAGVLTVSLAFVLQMLLFAACALVLLMVATVADASEQPGASAASATLVGGVNPVWVAHFSWGQLSRRVHAVLRWRLVAVACLLFLGVVAAAAFLFISIPRFQIENSLFLDKLITRKARTGFSESVRFGEVTDIMQDNGVALSVDVPSPERLPAEPYFRMLVLDEYMPEGGFRMSAQLKRELIANERSTWLLRGPRGGGGADAEHWTLYLEPGVSRYLPLPGIFASLRMRELQNIQFHDRLIVAGLRTQPVVMTAYRLEEVTALSSISDHEFAARVRSAPRGQAGLLPRTERLMLSLPESAAAREGLERLAAPLCAGPAGRLDAAAFGRRAGDWLASRHRYSLASRLPAGAGDPLLRWLQSTEPGHCELFAGSLVLLARAAGYPARLVVGFKGGSWNAYAGSLTVRNSDAHAWCELWDGSGKWIRVDPTPGADGSAPAAQTSDVGTPPLDRGWLARLESLRVFWYRRIVNFDQRTQLETIQGMREAAQGARRWSLERVDAALRAVKDWLRKTWDWRRAALTGALLAGVAGLVWLSRRALNDWRWRAATRGGATGAVRREAARWLRRLARETGSAADPEREALLLQLQRLRYGSSERWPEVGLVFARARRLRRG